MKSFFLLLSVLLLVVLALNVHIVHNASGLHILWKDQLTLKDTYVDLSNPQAVQMDNLSPAVRNLAMGSGGYPGMQSPMMPPYGGQQMPVGR